MSGNLPGGLQPGGPEDGGQIPPCFVKNLVDYNEIEFMHMGDLVARVGHAAADHLFAVLRPRPQREVP